jgi:protein-tyrosine-phosphatase
MAEAFFNKMSHSHRALAAGTKPAPHPLPAVVSSMQETGLAIVDRPALALTTEIAEQAELVVALGCDVAAECPGLTTPIEDWDLDDPKGKSADEVADIRDFIELRVRNLIGKLGREA